MRQTTGTRKSPGEKIVNDIKRATRKHYSSEEKTRIVLDSLRGENVQNRQLQTWLSEDEYAELAQVWEEQLELRGEHKDKPDELKRYDERLKQATFYYNRAERYSSKGKHTTARTFYNKSESLCEDALEIGA